MKRIFVFVSSLIFAFALCASGQHSVKEPSTGKSFPAEVSFRHGETEYTLKVTGFTVRKKLFFKVYGIAHYMDDPPKVGTEEEAFRAVMSDEKAKQITMEFARDVEKVKITEAYKTGFSENASEDESRKIEPLVNRFLGYFSKDVKENDVYILRWLPGGTVITEIQSEKRPAITDKLFARVLWSIWFGENSIVDNGKLVQLMLKK